MGPIRGKTLIRVCYVCHKEYQWTAGKTGQDCTFRRCPECSKIPSCSIKWSCPCGQVFTSRKKYYAHRKEMRDSGRYCGAQKDSGNTYMCPYCGRMIGASKNAEDTLKECKVTHRCERMKQLGVTSFNFYETLVDMLMRTRNLDYTAEDTDTALQLIWLKSTLEKYGYGEYHVILPDAGRTYRYMFIKDLDTAVLFDEPETSGAAYRALGWETICIRWLDCMLDTEQMERKVVLALERQKKLLSAGQSLFSKSVEVNLPIIPALKATPRKS